MTVLRLALPALVLLVLVGCGRQATTRDHDEHPTNAPATTDHATTASSQPPTPSVLASSTVRPPAAATMPDPRAATRDALGAARGWAIAAYSSSYRDPTPGSWTDRARSFVTSAEASVERVAAAGTGGTTWAQIRSQRCALTLRGLRVTVAADAPSGPRARVVELTGMAALTCATGTIDLRPVAVQLVVINLAGRWLVDTVTY